MTRASRSILVRFATPAFSLVEMIVVIAMIAILAAVITPRFAGMSARAALNEARDAERLLNVAAEKSLLSFHAVSLSYDSNAKRLTLLIQRAAVAANSRNTPVAASDPAIAWRPDPLVEPAEFQRLTLKQALIDGRAMPPAGWTVVFVPGERRPDVRLVLEPPASIALLGSRIDIGLAPESSSATISGFGIPPTRDAGVRVIDLDDAGRGSTPW